ncbi:g2817 [Coccomyxa viridis]|uniref:G2817 protein n=1 Tax=Coccomyxa viridis TaxID=1274662 RepID=A0ABP1FNL5_9CHLO
MRNYSHSNAPVSCGESAVHKALGAEGAYWNIGIGPHAAYTAFRQTGQHTPRAFTGPGKLSVRGYQSYNSFVKSYQYGGRPSRFDCETALRLLVGANVVAWINWQLDPAFMANHFMTSLNHIREGRWYTIVTACFSHRDPLHLFGNMLTLYFFWNRAFSGRLVMFLYLVGGAVGSAAFLYQEHRQLPKTQYMSTYNREVGIRRSPPALGASGSVNASVIFNILYSPYSTVLIYGILPMPAWALGGLWLAYDISGAMGRELTPGRASVGYAAHLGGAATGALTYFAYRRGRLRL